MTNRFYDKTLLITGCSGEMAIEIAGIILQDGGRVVGLDFHELQLEDTRNLFRGKEYYAFCADISDKEQVARSMQHILERFPPIDILINHAGSTSSETLATTTPENWEKDILINLNGTFWVTNLILESMKERRRGNIVTIASVNADQAIGNPAYSAAKAGLVAFSKAIAMEYGPYNIRSNVVSPGSVKTKAWGNRIKNDPEIFDNLLKWYPLKRLATPKAIANAALFLASDDADCISGVNLRVDAGLSAGNALFAQSITQHNFGAL